MAKKKSKLILKKKTTTIPLAGTLEGGHAKVRDNIPMQMVIDIQSIEDMTRAEQHAVIMKFGDDVLLEWNLATEEGDIPATGEGLLSLGVGEYLAFFRAWGDSINGDKNLDLQQRPPEASV